MDVSASSQRAAPVEGSTPRGILILGLLLVFVGACGVSSWVAAPLFDQKFTFDLSAPLSLLFGVGLIRRSATARTLVLFFTRLSLAIVVIGMPVSLFLNDSPMLIRVAGRVMIHLSPIWRLAFLAFMAVVYLCVIRALQKPKIEQWFSDGGPLTFSGFRKQSIATAVLVGCLFTFGSHAIVGAVPRSEHIATSTGHGLAEYGTQFGELSYLVLQSDQTKNVGENAPLSFRWSHRVRDNKDVRFIQLKDQRIYLPAERQIFEIHGEDVISIPERLTIEQLDLFLGSAHPWSVDGLRRFLAEHASDQDSTPP